MFVIESCLGPRTKQPVTDEDSMFEQIDPNMHAWRTTPPLGQFSDHVLSTICVRVLLGFYGLPEWED